MKILIILAIIVILAIIGWSINGDLPHSIDEEDKL